MESPILRTEGLRYEYGSGFSLRDVSVAFYEGERVAVLGSNGSGKSTFFLNLDGVLPHSGGSIYLGDTLVTKKSLNALRKAVGIVFQDPDSQTVCSTVESEVAFGVLNLGFSEEEALRRTDLALRRMELTHLRDRPVHYLSGGQKKSVTIADVLAMEPKVIVFDEPTASLDPLSCESFERVLGELGRGRVTTLVSTHDVDFAWRWADRVLVFDGGELIADATPSEVFEDSELLRRAHLKEPTLLSVTRLLVQRGALPEGTVVKSVEDLDRALGSR